MVFQEHCHYALIFIGRFFVLNIKVNNIYLGVSTWCYEGGEAEVQGLLLSGSVTVWDFHGSAEGGCLPFPGKIVKPPAPSQGGNESEDEKV